MNLRNIAIIAHVDHGKTTLVDGLLKQSKTFRDNESFMSQSLIMDSNDQERERGITILAKNTSVNYKDTKINIIDTPGHSDFGGEVERILNMADGALLLVDAQEGPMPQTKFVLKKAFDMGLKIIVIINKIDKKHVRIAETLKKIDNLFLELATTNEQLDFPILYAVGRNGQSWKEIVGDAVTTIDSDPNSDLSPIFEEILKHIPAPTKNDDAPFQMLVSTLDWDNFKGKYAIGRIHRGIAKVGMSVTLLKSNGEKEDTVIEKIFINQGLKRTEVNSAESGEIVAITGIKNAGIGDTVADSTTPEALPTIKIDEPTLSISVSPNTSPFMGQEGKFFTSRHILERIEREMQTNVAMRFKKSNDDIFVISGRGELHLSVFLETLRRENFELSVGRPTVLTKFVDGVEMEPMEELTIDVGNNYVGNVKSEIGQRRGVLISQEELTSESTRLVYEISTRGILGLRSNLLTLSKGTAIMSSNFLRYDKMGPPIQKLRKGVLIASASGNTAPYGLIAAQSKGPIFVSPQQRVYEGMIVGLNGRDEDLEINVCKEKQLTNNRSSGEGVSVALIPPVIMSLEQCLVFLENDELLEITPHNLRLRKKILNSTQRMRENRRNSGSKRLM
ncbi:MAG: translational GTPase TypA [Patescibacteria group bacterium]